MASGGGEKSVSGDGNNDRGLTPGEFDHARLDMELGT